MNEENFLLLRKKDVFSRQALFAVTSGLFRAAGFFDSAEFLTKWKVWELKEPAADRKLKRKFS